MKHNYKHDKYKQHLGHKIECVQYGDGQNISIECIECCEVLDDAELFLEV